VLEATTSDSLSREETINARRLIEKAYARDFEHDYENARKALRHDDIAGVKSENAARRQTAIQEQLEVRGDWRIGYRLWNGLHYLV